MINDILNQAFANQGKFTSEYSKPVDKAVYQLMNTQIRTDNGEYSVVFFNRIDKKANIIEIQLSKVAMDNQQLLLDSL